MSATVKQISVLQSNGSYLSKDIGVDAQNVDIDNSHTLADKINDWENKIEKISVNGVNQTITNKNVNIVIPKDSPVPDGGKTGQVLTKKSDTDGDAEWKDIGSTIPKGGTVGQVLTKKSDTDGDAQWEDASSSYTFKDSEFIVSEEGLVSLDPSQKTILITQEDYDALSKEEQENGATYFITNGEEAESFGNGKDITRFVGTHEDWESLPPEEQAPVTDIIYTDDNDGNGKSSGNKTGSSSGFSYKLPIASADTLGGVKVGPSLSIDENGILDLNNINNNETIIGKVGTSVLCAKFITNLTDKKLNGNSWNVTDITLPTGAYPLYAKCGDFIPAAATESNGVLRVYNDLQGDYDYTKVFVVYIK